MSGKSAGGGTGGTSRYRGDILTKTSDNNTGVNPEIIVTYTSSSEGSGGTETTTKTTISGAQTKRLTLSTDAVGKQNVKCLITHPTAALNYDQVNNPSSANASGGVLNNGLVTPEATFEAISAVNAQRSILNYEVVNDNNASRYVSGSQNLFLNDQAFATSTTTPTDTFTIFAPEEDIAVLILLQGSAGQGFNGNSGGEGGRCTFTHTLLKNVEYTLKLGATVEPTGSFGRGGAGAFFYEKGRLLVACGGGGASGYFGGDGGAGGGAGVSGGSGGGSAGGNGGVRFFDGQMPASGELPDGRNGGKVEACTTGNYWNSSFSPCSDIGNEKFFTAGGQDVTNSTEIQRGYKADSSDQAGFRHNGGNSNSAGPDGFFVGGGGAGARGGDAARNNSSGGGGAGGYTDGTVTIISTSQGGNTSNLASAIVRVVT